MNFYKVGLHILCYVLLWYNLKHLYFRRPNRNSYQQSIKQLFFNSNEDRMFSLHYSRKSRYYDYLENENRFHYEETYNVINESTQVHAIIITVGFRLSPQLNHTLTYLNYIYRKYGVRTVVFTENVNVSRRCMELELATEPFQQTNSYGMPILRSLLLYVQDHYDTDLYIYLNNVLINPHVLLLSEIIQKDFSSLFLFTGRATLLKPISYPIDMFDYNRFIEMGSHAIRRQGPTEMDYFVFSKSFPFELLEPVVVGRFYVNNAVMLLSHSMKLNIVDFSQIECFVLKEENDCSNCPFHDYKYNTKYLSARMVRREGTVLSNFYIRVNSTDSIVFYSKKIEEKAFQTFENLPDNY